MKELKIAYGSDFHIDFYVKNHEPNDKHKRSIKNFIDTQLKPEKADVLIMAGDESHYNIDTMELITQLKKYYTHIAMVGGNHSMYFVTEGQKKKYDRKSSNRLNEMKGWCDNQENVYYLDGTSFEVNGIKISGLMNWYDLSNGGKEASLGKLAQWNEVLNDSNLIIEGFEPSRISYGYGASHKESNWDTQAYFDSEMEKFDNIVNEKCNILVTHVCPIIIPDEHQSRYYVGDRNNIFYMNDNVKRVKDSGAEVVIFGHQHDVRKFEVDEVEYLINALGYPMEQKFKKIEHFIFHKE